MHGSYSLLFATKDGGDANGLKLEKNWPDFSSLETLASEVAKS